MRKIFLLIQTAAFLAAVFALEASFTPLKIFQDISNLEIPEVFYPSLLPDETHEMNLSIVPNYFLTNFSFPVRGWWKVFYEPDTFYVVDDIPPFLKVKFHLQTKNVVFHLEAFSGREYMALRKWPDTSFFYIPTYPHVSFDLRFPYVSYLAFNFGKQQLFIGRGKVRWGYWKYPVALSGIYPYLDNITYSLNSGWGTYSFTIASINPVLTDEEKKVQDDLRPVNADPLSPYKERTKNLVAHRLEFRPSDNFFLSIGELTMVGGKTPDLFSIDPLAILHNNFNEGYTNSMLDVQSGYTLIPGLNLYFEFALDDFAVPLTEPKDVKPTAYGLTTGLIKTVDSWLKGYLELSYVRTTRWMYNTFLPYLKFNARYVFLSNFPVGSRAIVDYPLGFEYGPDSTMYSFYLNITKPLKADLEFSLLEKGPVDLETKYKEEVTGGYERFFMVKSNVSFKNGVNIFLKIVNGKYMFGGWWRSSVNF